MLSRDNACGAAATPGDMFMGTGNSGCPNVQISTFLNVDATTSTGSALFALGPALRRIGCGTSDNIWDADVDRA